MSEYKSRLTEFILKFDKPNFDLQNTHEIRTFDDPQIKLITEKIEDQIKKIGGEYDNLFEEKIRLEWNTIRAEFFNQNDFYRDLKPHEYNLYLVPNVLKAKKLFGCSLTFFQAVTIFVWKVLFQKKGNQIDKYYASYIENLLVCKDKTIHEKIDLVYNHIFWSGCTIQFS